MIIYLSVSICISLAQYLMGLRKNSQENVTLKQKSEHLVVFFVC